MAIDYEMIKEIRKTTGAGMQDCMNALKESDGSMQKAINYLREKGIKVASKKASRNAEEGIVGSYIHPPGKIGVLVEVNCETDFVARTDDFQEFVLDVAIHIAANSPVAVSRDDLPAEMVEGEKAILRKQLADSGKPDSIIEKIISGRMEKFYAEVCLLDQEWLHDSDKGSVKDVLTDIIGRFRENIVIRRFSKFTIGTR